MYKPVENETYSVKKDGEWFTVIYKRDERRYNVVSDPIAHYKTEEKAEHVAAILNEHSEI